MSDVSNTENNGAGEDTEQPYTSQLDPAFSEAWNSVFVEEEEGAAGAGGDSAAAAGSGDSSSAATDQGAAAAGTDAATSTAGDDLGQLSGALQSAAGASESSAAASGNGADGATAATAEPTGVDVATITPLFSKANDAINTRMQETFVSTSEAELKEDVDPRYYEALDQHPYELAGQEVPSIRPEGGMVRLKDTEEARNWQEATKQLLKREVQKRAEAKAADARPILSVLQESALMFENNPDLVPGTKQYDQELADKFIEIAKTYELRVDGRLYGYQVNVQPIINGLRADLAKQRGASGVTAQQAKEAQQRRAAEQNRNQANGQFLAEGGPQAGIASRQAGSGQVSEDDDYSPFFQALGLPNLGNI